MPNSTPMTFSWLIFLPRWPSQVRREPGDVSPASSWCSAPREFESPSRRFSLFYIRAESTQQLQLMEIRTRGRPITSIIIVQVSPDGENLFLISHLNQKHPNPPSKTIIIPWNNIIIVQLGKEGVFGHEKDRACTVSCHSSRERF